MRTLPLALIVFISLSASAAFGDESPYFEYCGTTQWKTTDGQVGGGTGHAFTYIKGLCKNYSEKYPQVVPCDELTSDEQSAHPHDGVGISLDKNFSNVNWIAVPDRDLMFFGSIERRSPTANDVVALQRKAAELKVFEGVKLLDGKVEGQFGTDAYADNVARNTLGTDIAVNWARSLYCVKIPVKKESLISVAAYLNKQNQLYQFGEPYKWDKFSNNCVHLSMNQGHALGINKHISTDRPMPLALFNLALPANAYMMYADLAVLKKPSYGKIKKDVRNNGFSTTQVGSLLSNHEAYPNGEIFLTEGLGIQTAPRISKPFKLLMTPEKYKKYLTDENSNESSNAQKWVAVYREFLEKAEKKNEEQKFIDYLKNQLHAASDILAQ